jgi:hypothetical protein
MNAEEAIQQIQEALATETSAIKLSNRLFSPQGLFQWLAATDEQRKQLVTAPLFHAAQRRLRELQHREAAAFGKTLRRVASASGSQNPGEHAPTT